MDEGQEHSSLWQVEPISITEHSNFTSALQVDPFPILQKKLQVRWDSHPLSHTGTTEHGITAGDVSPILPEELLLSRSMDHSHELNALYPTCSTEHQVLWQNVLYQSPRHVLSLACN